ncbi:MAG: hypothetical protein WDZ48_03540, partial [Pirellulales bacterium]
GGGAKRAALVSVFAAARSTCARPVTTGKTAPFETRQKPAVKTPVWRNNRSHPKPIKRDEITTYENPLKMIRGRT